MRNLKNLEKFYDRYHSVGSTQNKIIGDSNFTYTGAIKDYKLINKNHKKLKILDYGCGVGTFSLYLAQYGHKVIGIDVSEKAIKLSNQNAISVHLDKSVNFHTLKSWKSEKYRNFFDCVVALEVIEHVQDDLKLLVDFNSYLKKGGFLIISTPTVNAPLYKLGLLVKFDQDVGHLRRYKLDSLLKKIESCGFQISSVRKTEGIFRNMLYVYPNLGIFIKFFKGPISRLVTFIDEITIQLLGESNVHIIAIKK